jgi:hypothetical protein
VKRAALAYRCCSSLPLRGQQLIVHKLNSSEFLVIKKLFPLVECPCHYSREFENSFPIVAGAIFKSSMLGFQLVAAKLKLFFDNIELNSPASICRETLEIYFVLHHLESQFDL